MRRGSIYWINLEPSHPPEFGKIRPGLIISNSEQNLRLSTVVILPLSSQPPEIWPLRVGFKGQKGKESFVVVPGIRQVSKERLQTCLGMVPESFLERVDEALEIYLKD